MAFSATARLRIQISLGPGSGYGAVTTWNGPPFLVATYCLMLLLVEAAKDIIESRVQEKVWQRENGYSISGLSKPHISI